MRHHFELQLPHGAENHQATDHRSEHLNRPLFAELFQRLAKLLGAHRIHNFNRLENFRREERQADELQRLAFSQRIAKAQRAVIRNTDDVTRIRFADRLAALRQERHHVVGAERLVRTRHLQRHAALEMSRTHADKRHAIAVRQIHVRLHLEHHASELRLIRLHRPLHGHARRRRGRQID